MPVRRLRKADERSDQKTEQAEFFHIQSYSRAKISQDNDREGIVGSGFATGSAIRAGSLG
jgi:hypothetical protein